MDGIPESLALLRPDDLFPVWCLVDSLEQAGEMPPCEALCWKHGIYGLMERWGWSRMTSSARSALHSSASFAERGVQLNKNGPLMGGATVKWETSDFGGIGQMAEGTIKRLTDRASGLSTPGATRTYFFTRQTSKG